MTGNIYIPVNLEYRHTLASVDGRLLTGFTVCRSYVLLYTQMSHVLLHVDVTFYYTCRCHMFYYMQMLHLTTCLQISHGLLRIHLANVLRPPFCTHHSLLVIYCVPDITCLTVYTDVPHSIYFRQGTTKHQKNQQCTCHNDGYLTTLQSISTVSAKSLWLLIYIQNMYLHMKSR